MAVIDQLQAQLKYLDTLDFYRRKFQQASVDIGDVKSLEDFQKLPFTTSKEFQAEIQTPPSECSLYSPEVTRVNLSPSGQELYPVYQTNKDLEFMHQVCARSLKAAGVTPQDMVAVTFGYHLFIAGLFYQGQFEYYGSKVIPLGPGESTRAVQLINDYQIGVLISNPTFAMKLAEAGIPSVHTIFVGGEPFTSVQGYPEKVRAAFERDITIIDSYSMALCMPIARSCRHNTGLHIMDEFVYTEVIDPATGEPVPLGEKGELVLTHLHKQAAPLLRYRTGDLTMLENKTCACGRELTMPQSVIGRTDDMLKIKGVKFWPSQLATILRSYPQFSPQYRLVVDSLKGVDTLSLVVEGKTDDAPVLDKLATHLKSETLLKFNEIRITEKLEDGPNVVDKRKGRSF